jgi:long-chain acyl-CoA synthetase
MVTMKNEETMQAPVATHPEQGVPDGFVNLADAIATRCRRLPSAPVVGGQEGLRWRHLNGRQFLARTEALAAELRAREVRAGDRVVVWVPNGWRTPVLFTAIWRLGAIVVPFDREMNVEAARTILGMVEPRLILTGYDQRPAWAVDGAPLEEWWEPTGDRSFPAIATDQERTTTAMDQLADETVGVAAIYFTSGTTGAPKGCTITHRNLLSQVSALRDIVTIKEGDTFGSILPLSHLFELTCGMLYPIIQGACVEYIPSRKGPDIVRVLHEQRVSHMVVVPQVLALMGAAAADRLRGSLGEQRYELLLRLADRSPMSVRRLLFRPVLRRLGGRLRMVASGGAALDPEVQRLWERLGIRTLQGYGASECSPIIACGRPDGSTPYGTVGLAVPGVEVKLDAGGQLLARGPNVMRGYWRDPERTAKAIDQDGFYATGDICERDAAGNIRIMGRAQELLVLPSGMNVWPEDVEEQLRRASGVKDAVVILVPGTAGGATLHAYLLPDGAPDPAGLPAIVAQANGQLAVHQRVATASWWAEEDFPRTSTLKVKRRLIPFPSDLPAPATGPSQTGGMVRVDLTQSHDDPVLAAVRAVSGNAQATDSQTLAALGLDSLGITALIVDIESRTGANVPEGSVDSSMSVAALRAAIAALAAEEGAVAIGEDAQSEDRIKRREEAFTWLPPLWLYTRGRFLRRLSAPIGWLHRWGVPHVYVVGAEHLRALDRGAILAGTHRSYPDVPTIKRALAESPTHRHGDRLVIAASSVIVGRAGLFGKFATAAFGLFPLRQYGGHEESLRRLAQIADAGNTILIFPQGHHTNPDDELRCDPSADFKPGIGRLAIDLGLPVLPFGLAGTERVVSPTVPEGFKGRVIAGIPVAVNRRPVAIAFGAPMAPEPGESPAAFAARLRDVCFALSWQAEASLAGRRAI